MKCANCRKHVDGIADLKEHVKSSECRAADPWGAVVDAKANGTFSKAKRLRREILGIETKPMPPEAIAAKREAGTGASDALKRKKAFEKAEMRELMKPANNRRMKTN